MGQFSCSSNERKRSYEDLFAWNNPGLIGLKFGVFCNISYIKAKLYPKKTPINKCWVFLRNFRLMKFYFHILRFHDLLVFWFMINIANELYWSSYYQKIIEISWSLSSLVCDSIVFDWEVVLWRCSVKIVFLKISKIWQENTIEGVSFLIKLPSQGMTSTQLLCRNFCETFKTFPHLLREDRANYLW